MKIYTAQINPTVGDIAGNFELIINAYKKGSAMGADIVMLPELALSGYSPDDLLLIPQFIADCYEYVQKIASATNNTAILFGSPYPSNNKKPYNAALFCYEGEVKHIITKTDLCSFSVFDEDRYFTPCKTREVIEFKGVKIGIPICRDTWLPNTCKELADLGAEILLSINASPYYEGKHLERIDFVTDRVNETSCPLIYLNMVGGQDGIIFDGRSFAKNVGESVLVYQLEAWKDGFCFFEVTSKGGTYTLTTICEPYMSTEEYSPLKDVYSALMLGLKDYTHKNGFSNVIIGLSGGVDSALVVTLAVDTLGKENVLCVIMPSQYTSNESLEDAWKLAENLGCDCTEMPINSAMETFNNMYQGSFEEFPQGLAIENLQARIRGTMLMTISNSIQNSMLLTTGNKSEIAVGYCTLYGDMCGGYNPIKDIYKTQVYDLCRWRNEQKQEKTIPDRIINKAPSAELRPNQKDMDSLPEYDILDGILKHAIEGLKTSTEITKLGFNAEDVNLIMKLLKNSEYKRKQSATGTKISRLSFEKDWRMPTTNGYK